MVMDEKSQQQFIKDNYADIVEQIRKQRKEDEERDIESDKYVIIYKFDKFNGRFPEIEIYTLIKETEKTIQIQNYAHFVHNYIHRQFFLKRCLSSFKIALKIHDKIGKFDDEYRNTCRNALEQLTDDLDNLMENIKSE